jgi:hypothetical protein
MQRKKDVRAQSVDQSGNRAEREREKKKKGKKKEVTVVVEDHGKEVESGVCKKKGGSEKRVEKEGIGIRVLATRSVTV